LDEFTTSLPHSYVYNSLIFPGNYAFIPVARSSKKIIQIY